jgi:NHLM bacteriocin system ABC transporter ATP-binding protein
MKTALTGEEIWFTKTGYADVFVSSTRPDGAAARRHHLFRATQGSLIFALPPSRDFVFEAVGTASTVLERVGRNLVDERIRNKGQAIRVVEQWIDRLCESVGGGVPPGGCVSVALGQEIPLDAGTSLRPMAGTACLELLSGRAALFADDDALVGHDDVVPVSWRAWVTMRERGVVRAVPLAEIAERGDLWKALEALHRLAAATLRHRLEWVVAVERERLSTKSAAAAAAHVRAFAELAATFHGVRASEALAAPAPLARSTPHDELNAACRAVAVHLGMPFVAPPTTSYRTAREGVENVARASRFRVRQVVLADSWWRHDEGPFVAFLKEDNRAVALLSRSASGYVLVDPQTSAARPVTSNLAATLGSSAFTFYRPFDAGPVGILQLARFGLHGCRRELATVVASGAFVGMIATLIPIGTGVLINSIIPSTERGQLLGWTLMLLVCTLVSGMFYVTRSIALIRLEMKLAYAIQSALWDRLISLPARFFRDYPAGNLASRAMGFDAVRQTLSGATVRAVLGGIFSVFNFALLFFYDLRLAFCALGLIALALTVFATLAYLQRIQQREVVSIQAKTSGVVLQLLTGIRKLRVGGAEPRAFAIWAQLFSRQRRAQYRIRALSNSFRTFYVSFPLVAYGVLFTVILMTPTGDSLRTGDFVAFLAAFSGCIEATLATASAAISALAVVPQYEMARPILEATPEVSPGQADPGELAGDITIDQAVFRYRPDSPPVLNGLTFRVRAGEFAAFVGPSGSGKSTVLRLLLGFETLESGAIYFDGRDFKDLDRRAVRRQIGVVLQSGKLMPGDIFTNIVGCSSATLEEAWTASRLAGLDEDIKRMPMGMHTMVTDGGGTLSGGQRQRLMIARAIVTAPRMLFFDEATSALDNQTQAIVSQSLERLHATRIVIAHRLSTIVKADRIFVVEKGRIVQSGTYEELIAQPGLFRELASRQLA